MSKLNTRSRPILNALDRLIRRIGPVRAADRAAGKANGWWQARVRAGEIPLGELLAVLDYCGLDEGTFLRKTLGKEDFPAVDRPLGEAPAIVTRALERVATGRKVRGLSEAFLSSLDEERYSDRKKATEMALWAVDKIEDSLLPRLLGVAGSTYRLQVRPREAHHCIYAGLELARQRHDPLAEANLIQRLAYVVADEGHYKAALRLSRSAAWAYMEHGDLPGLGTALVDQGTWLSRLGRPDAAIETRKLALEHLEPDQRRHRCAANHGLALSYKELGKFPEALSFIAATEELVGSVDPLTRCKLPWLKGEILARQGDLGRAEKVLRTVVSRLATLHPGECVIAACDLVNVQLKRGRGAQAYAVAASLVRLMGPLSGNRILSAAIAELLRGGREGLTRSRVSKVLGQLARAREDRKRWRSLLGG